MGVRLYPKTITRAIAYFYGIFPLETSYKSKSLYRLILKRYFCTKLNVLGFFFYKNVVITTNVLNNLLKHPLLTDIIL